MHDRTVLPLIVGSYTEQLPHVEGKAEGLLAAWFDTTTGRISSVSTLITARNPSFVALSPCGSILYAVNEVRTFQGVAGGGVEAFARDPVSGALSRLNTRPTGVDPCHLVVDPTGRFVLTANYGDGSVTVFRIEDDGRLGEPTDQVRHQGRGTDHSRQAGPHVHMIACTPWAGEVLVTDLGLDQIRVYSLDARGRLTPRPTARIDTPPGAGPRHLALSPDGIHLFVVNELDNTVLTLRRSDNRYQQSHRVSTLPANFDAHNRTSAIRVTPSGRLVLVANRGHDSIAMLRFDELAGTLRLIGTAPIPGQEPRDLVVTQDGRHVIVAAQESNLLVSYELDEEIPELRMVHSVPAPSPSSVFLG
ncbi:6-phosphogluconolactonase [Streptacidiphilus sp. BW17]|uniref:lactonase family protein n=1 Tax=unclassified Streptacidiphilus TaxID=2643834 RepID=UPI003516B042